MDIEIRKMSTELAGAFFDLFDNRAFTDNSPEDSCYCTRFQMMKDEEQNTPSFRR